MKAKTAVRVLLWHLEFFVLGTALFVFLFHTGLFRNITVFFYRGIALLLVDCLFMVLLIAVIKFMGFRKSFAIRDVIISILLIFSLNLVFFTHLPVTADRSVSVFLLGYINSQSDKILTKKEITKVFVDKYIYEYEAMDKRLSEQIISGNIVEEGSGYRITGRGKFVMSVYGFVADVFTVDKRIVSPD